MPTLSTEGILAWVELEHVASDQNEQNRLETITSIITNKALHLLALMSLATSFHRGTCTYTSTNLYGFFMTE